MSFGHTGQKDTVLKQSTCPDPRWYFLYETIAQIIYFILYINKYKIRKKPTESPDKEKKMLTICQGIFTPLSDFQQ